MGSYGGHVLPGTCFMIMGFWTPIQTMLANYCKNRNENAFKRTDSIVIMFLASVGIFVELFWPFHNNPPYGHLYEPGTDHFWMPMNWQHFTMYLFFDFYGFCRYLQNSGYQMVKGVDRLAGALAFGVEGYLFYNHVHGRSPLDTKIHLLITLVCVSTALVWTITFFMENKRKIFILDIIISILVFAQGTWFWHVAIILYGKHPWVGSPALDEHMHDSHMNEEEEHVAEDAEHDHEHEHDQMGVDMGEHMDDEHINTMFAVLFFAWHIAAAIAIISGISFAIYKYMEKRGTLRDEVFGESQLNNNSVHATSKMNGGYKPLEVDETPLLQSVDDEENVLFTK